MVAENIPLPNIRKLFIADDGYILCEADLSGADAQVVAWEAGDEDLKSAFRDGLKLHIKNARDVYPESCRGMSDADLKATDYPGGIYHNCKRRVHATNYVGSAHTLAATLKTSVAEEERFQSIWFRLHPGIKDWHDRYERHLQGTECWNCNLPAVDTSRKCDRCGSHLGRTIRNAFGYRIVYFDRVESLLPKACAWTPQSTVALICRKGMMKVRREFPCVQMLLQVHDSVVFQVHEQYEDILPEIHKALHVTVPYEDPLTIQWSFATTRGCWGDLS